MSNNPKMTKIPMVCALACAVIMLALPDADAALIDLTAEEMYVRAGFSAKWTAKLPSKEDAAWERIAPGINGQRSVRVIDLKLPDIPARTPFSLYEYPPQTFTFVSRFRLDSGLLEKGKILGLLLAHAADNWEIYINGLPVRGEMHVGADGSITLHKSSRHILVPLDPRTLKAGENVLAVKVYGDPTFSDVGFLHRGPYVIDEMMKLTDSVSESIPLIFIFLYGFVGLYYLFLFINRRKEIYNLYYGLFCLALFVYLFMRTHSVQNLLPDSNMVLRFELLSLYTLIPLLGMFLDSMLERRISIFTWAYGGFCGLLILLTALPTTQPFAVDVLRVWQYTSIMPIVYYAVYRIGFRFYRGLKTTHEKRLHAVSRYPWAGALRETLARTIAGNLLFGVFVLAATTIFDIVDAAFFSSDIVLTRYGFFMFVIGTALIISNKFIGLQIKNERLNESLRQKISDLDEANSTISISEEKYRLLVEGTNECIFTLDGDLRFRNANKAMMKFLRAAPEETKDLSLFDILLDDPQDAGVARTLLVEKLETLKSEGIPVTAKVVFQPIGASEPQDFVLRLEGITIEGKNEILGRASHVMEDSLLNYFVSERQKYEIGNFLITAEEISQRLVRNLARYIGPRDVNYMRIGLREMIINAIEHGNLDISFDEKTTATMDDNYLEFVFKRQREPAYRGKKVRIEYLLSPDRVAYKIADDGNGFDYRAMMASMRDRVNEEMLYHGRGITMAVNIFDKITYNKKGNEVLLEKFLAREKNP